MEIYQLLTLYNNGHSQADRIKYIVIHYVGALGGVEANCNTTLHSISEPALIIMWDLAEIYGSP